MKRDDASSTATCEGEAFRKANGVVKGAEMPETSNVSRAFYDNLIRLEKSDPKANYRFDGSEGYQCGECRFFDAAYRCCSLVEGTIEKTATCDLYTERLPSQPEYLGMYSEPSVQIFVDATKAFKGKRPDKEWIPFLPTPGVFKHPLYGDVEVTLEGNQAFVQNFKDEVYQKHIPLDAEHETKLSGAVAWITDMRVNDDGGADAYVEWTDRGKTLVEGGQFKYVSPEWFDEWTDPATEKVYKNIIAGGAITTRPFFKDKVLRALVASEQGTVIVAAEAGMKTCAGCGKKYSDSMAACPSCGSTKVAAENPKEPDVPDPKTYAEGSPELQAIIDAAKADAAKGLLAPDSDEFKEAVRVAAEAAKTASEPSPENKAFAERLTAAETQAAELKTANEALASSLKTITNAERRRRFSDLVAGRGGENDGGAWVGDKDKHVAFLEKLADKVGEEDEMFTSFVEQQNALAAQAATAELFSQAGSSSPAPSGGAAGAEAKLNQLARTRMAADPTKPLDFAAAYSEVLTTPEGAKLYQEISDAATRRGA
jgi:hypothetical protein